MGEGRYAALLKQRSRTHVCVCVCVSYSRKQQHATRHEKLLFAVRFVEFVRLSSQSRVVRGWWCGGRVCTPRGSLVGGSRRTTVLTGGRSLRVPWLSEGGAFVTRPVVVRRGAFVTRPVVVRRGGTLIEEKPANVCLVALVSIIVHDSRSFSIGRHLKLCASGVRIMNND